MSETTDGRHSFIAHRIPSEGFQAACSCGWRGGVVGNTVLEAHAIYGAMHDDGKEQCPAPGCSLRLGDLDMQRTHMTTIHPEIVEARLVEGKFKRPSEDTK